MKAPDASIAAGRPTLPEQLDNLVERVLGVGTLVETAIARAVASLIKYDPALARSVIAADKKIDDMEVVVEERCLEILDHEHPTGADLRFVVAVLKINSALERIGDLAENIAKTVVKLTDCERFKHVAGCRELAAAAQAMVKKSIQSLVDRDVAMAKAVIVDDREVDRLHKSIQQKVEEEIDRCPEKTTPLMQLVFATRQLERIGDMSTNIAEDVIFMVGGKIVRHVL